MKIREDELEDNTVEANSRGSDAAIVALSQELNEIISGLCENEQRISQSQESQKPRAEILGKISELLQQGADPFYQDESPAAFWLVFSDLDCNQEVMKIFIDNMKDCNGLDSDFLIDFMGNFDEDLSLLLVEKNIPISLCHSDKGGGALLWSMVYGYDKVTQAILDRPDVVINPEPHEREETQAHFAARYSDADILDFYLKAKNPPNIDWRNNEDATALHFATNTCIRYPCVNRSQGEVYGLIEYLVNRKANVNLQDSQGRTPLHCLLSAAPSQQNKIDLRGKPLQGDFIKAAHYLINQGADVSIADKHNLTALDYAIHLSCDIECDFYFQAPRHHNHDTELSKHFIKMIVESSTFNSTKCTIDREIHELLMQMFRADQSFFSQSHEFNFAYKDEPLPQDVIDLNNSLQVMSSQNKASYSFKLNGLFDKIELLEDLISLHKVREFSLTEDASALLGSSSSSSAAAAECHTELSGSIDELID